MPSLPPRASAFVAHATRTISTAQDALARSARLQGIVLIGGLGLIAATLVGDHRRVHSELDAFGERVEMFVVAVPIHTGEEIASADVIAVSIPRRFHVTTAIDDLNGRIATYDLDPGDPLTESNTTVDTGTTIPEGWRALTIDAGPLVERLSPGTVVDVMANGAFLVEGALVLDVIDDARTVLIAVPQDRVVSVADAASVGIAVLAIAN